MLFPVGTVEITPRAAAALARVQAGAANYLERHQSGDWGDDADDRAFSDVALREGHQITSNYTLPDGTNLFIMTAIDRGSTRVLLADEFEVQDIDVQAGYAIWSSSYDIEKNPLIAVEEPHVDALLASLAATTALDVGTGTGRHAFRLARRGIRVTAIDQSPEMLAQARQTAQRAGLTVDFRLGRIEDGLPFDAECFDLLMCGLMLCHVADLAQAMAEFCRVLQPGGFLLLTDFHPAVIHDLGWRSSCVRPGTAYLLPNNRATRADYLNATTEAGLTIQTVIDVPIREVPQGFLQERLRQAHGDTPLCLIILAQRLVEAGEPLNHA
ncbi:MAG TPA: class I SAM-dependent methyltransferase [Roseiflexaceae bacterium]|nr:class I SAM-dependent methyltransferase [Roseiflexaceae bacterium]